MNSEDYETYSLRLKRLARGDNPVTYVYDPIPPRMRAQAFHALQAAIGSEFTSKGSRNSTWNELESLVMTEHGFFHSLPSPSKTYSRDPYDRVGHYLGSVSQTDRFLDVLEIGFRLAQQPILKAKGAAYIRSTEERVQGAVDNLNRRFGQNDLGYAFAGIPGLIVRVDTQFIHVEIVEPAIGQLAALGWDGPLNEFMQAHRHYRNGDNKSTMNESLKAFESTMKAILQARGCPYESTWQAKSLIKALFDNEIIPKTMESYFGGIRVVLESGVPPLRNKQSGHGQGPTVAEVSDYMAGFALHLTASNIVFLASAHNSTK